MEHQDRDRDNRIIGHGDNIIPSAAHSLRRHNIFLAVYRLYNLCLVEYFLSFCVRNLPIGLYAFPARYKTTFIIYTQNLIKLRVYFTSPRRGNIGGKLLFWSYVFVVMFIMMLRYLFPPPKRRLCDCFGLSVTYSRCLSFCEQDYYKSNHLISLKLTRRRRLKLGIMIGLTNRKND